MSVPTAELPASRPGARPGAGDGGWRPWLRGGRLLTLMAIVALVIGFATLTIPSTPSYDPWAWLVWGKEIIHGGLHTAGGPSWKPLPMIFTTGLAVFGHFQPDLWLVVARAGAVMAAAMSFRLAWRVVNRLGSEHPDAAGIERILLALAPLMAGLIATGSVLNSPGFISNNMLGYSEGVAVALMLVGVDRFIDGHRRAAFVFGFLASLDRPELWIFWVPYGAWLIWRDPGARRLVAALFVLTLALWFGPAGFSGVTRAQNPRSNSLAFAKCPFCSVLRKEAWPTLLNRVKVPAVIGILAAGFGLWRTRTGWWRKTGPVAGATPGRSLLLAIGLFGLLWWVGIALETQLHFSGNKRYLVIGTAPVAIAGGVAWGWLAQSVGRLLSWLSGRASSSRALAQRRVVVPVGTALALGLFLAVPPWIGENVVSLPRTHRALVYQAALRENLNTIIKDYGGPRKLQACGSIMIEGFQVPMLAWDLNVRTLGILAQPTVKGRLVTDAPRAQAPNVILQDKDTGNPHQQLLPLPKTIIHWEQLGVPYKQIAHVNTFRLFTACRK